MGNHFQAALSSLFDWSHHNPLELAFSHFAGSQLPLATKQIGPESLNHQQQTRCGTFSILPTTTTPPSLIAQLSSRSTTSDQPHDRLERQSRPNQLNSPPID